jgi:hypothetical protein
VLRERRTQSTKARHPSCRHAEAAIG